MIEQGQASLVIANVVLRLGNRIHGVKHGSIKLENKRQATKSTRMHIITWVEAIQDETETMPWYRSRLNMNIPRTSLEAHQAEAQLV